MVAKSADYHWWSGASPYCVWRRPLFRGCVIDIAANIKFICGEEVDLCLLEAGEDWTWKKKHVAVWESCESINTMFTCVRRIVIASVPSFISLESWSCSSRGLISPAAVLFMMVSTSARALLRRKLKSPTQKTWSNLVVTSATIENDTVLWTKIIWQCYQQPQWN